MKTMDFEQKNNVYGDSRMNSLCKNIADHAYLAYTRSASLMKTKFSLFGLMILLAISFSSCQKNNDLKIEEDSELIVNFDNTISQYKNFYYNSAIPYTKSVNNDEISSLISQGAQLPLDVKNYLKLVISTSGSCENLEELRDHIKGKINDLNKLNFEDNIKDGCIKSLSLYVASIEIAISNQNMTKGYITPQERALIGQAAKNDSVASVVWGWASGTATGGPSGGVLGAIGAIIWELL
jgi:hypothetical protein